ncbi:MAG: hypothetical protein JJ863_01395 [Deltaproteobacteria bacterium]|nr:hypothetical protein [Deltaproteobacteria bacterium]
MKTITFIGAMLALTACSPTMKELDLEAAGLPATMQAPEGASAEAGPLESVHVTAEGFDLVIRKRELDLAAEKAEVSGNDRYALAIDTPDALLTEFEAMGGPFYRAHVNVTVGGETWSCETDALANVTDSSMGEAMVEACRSLTAK